MCLDFDDAATRRLRAYARAVAEVLGLSGDSWCVEAEHPAEVYLALDVRLGRFPDRDVALLWGEGRGWSVAVETSSGEDLVLVDSYPGELFPEPVAVGEWARATFRRWSTSRSKFPTRVVQPFAELVPETRSA